MTARQFLGRGLTALAASFILAGFGPADAASRVAHEIPKTTSVKSTGPTFYPTPLAGLEVFSAAERGATNPTGTAGVSLSGTDLAGARTSGEEAAVPLAYGLSLMPYTTAKVAGSKLGPSTVAELTPVSSPPYRATGKLFIHYAVGGWAECTAAMIRKGVLITAAHCVFKFGKKGAGWPDAMRFYPANYAKDPATVFGKSPYGFYVGNAITLSSTWYDGTDTCQKSGISCNNDLATVTLDSKAGKYAGEVVGWYNYAWNGYGYKAVPILGDKRLVLVTQLGYPAAFEDGHAMLRTDAVGFFSDYDKPNLKVTLFGSAQTPGASGGPVFVNFGTRPTINDATAASFGTQASTALIGVNSFVALEKGFNRWGASYWGQNVEFPAAAYGAFGAGNIGQIMQWTCTNYPASC